MPIGFGPGFGGVRPGFGGFRPGFGGIRPGFAFRPGFGARGFFPGFLFGSLLGTAVAPQYNYPPCPYWDPYCQSYYQY